MKKEETPLAHNDSGRKSQSQAEILQPNMAAAIVLQSHLFRSFGLSSAVLRTQSSSFHHRLGRNVTPVFSGSNNWAPLGPRTGEGAGVGTLPADHWHAGTLCRQSRGRGGAMFLEG